MRSLQMWPKWSFLLGYASSKLFSNMRCKSGFCTIFNCLFSCFSFKRFLVIEAVNMDLMGGLFTAWLHPKGCSQDLDIQMQISKKWCPFGGPYWDWYCSIFLLCDSLSVAVTGQTDVAPVSPTLSSFIFSPPAVRAKCFSQIPVHLTWHLVLSS